uniref:Keratin 99 n=1 Tax=Scophthalmus maximus TaxID=52904 RepID=A0A8D3BM19_SCOMX
MPVTLVGQSSSHSSRSISSSSAMSLSGGSQVFGGGQALVSARGFYQRRAPSVYGGAGGSGTRISQSVFTFGSGVFNNEKGAMQNLNDRLASYLEKVHSLEVANRKLEMQIREFCEQKTTISRDLSSYYVNITDLQTKIARSRLENHAVILQIDNAQLASTEVKTSYTQLSELKRTSQSLEINRQSILTEVGLRQNGRRQRKHVYTRLNSRNSNVVATVLIVFVSFTSAEHKPHIERRVKTIVEEIVDGQVVSSTVDTQLEEIQ